MTTIYSGLDIAKQNLQLHLAGRVHDLPNTPAAPPPALETPGQPQVRSRRLRSHRRLRTRGRRGTAPLRCACQRPEPRRVRHFARATGQRAKTDHIDASVLTQYGQALEPKATAPRTEQEQQLAETGPPPRAIAGNPRGSASTSRAADTARFASAGSKPRTPTGTGCGNKSKTNSENCAPTSPPWINESKSSKPSLASAPSRPWACWRNCPNWAPLTAARQRHWLDWLPIREKRPMAWKTKHRRRTCSRQTRSLHGGTGRRPLQSPTQGVLPALRTAGKPAKVALTAVMRKLIVLMNHTLKHPDFVLQN